MTTTRKATQDKLNRRLVELVDTANADRIAHAVRMEEWRTAAITLDPIENVIKVLTGTHHSDRILSLATREEALTLFKPSKIPLVDGIAGGCDQDAYRELEKCAAELVKKKVFRKKFVDQLREGYRKHRAENWVNEISASKKYSRTVFDERDLFQRCRNAGGTRVQCAHAVDHAEAVFRTREYPLPTEPPFTADFETAVNNQY